MNKIRILIYIIKQGFANTFKHCYNFLSSTFVIFVSLFIMGALALTSIGLTNILENMSEQRVITIDCDDVVSDEAAVTVLASIIDVAPEKIDGVRTVSKRENYEKALDMFGESAGFLVPTEDNEEEVAPYIESMFVSFVITLKTTEDVESFVDAARTVPGVHDVTDNLSIYEYFSNIQFWVKLGSLAAMIILGFLSVMLSINTIKLTVDSRKEELDIMKHIGASRSYMTGPFFIEGLLIGLIGSVAAFFSVRGVYIYIYNYVASQGDSVASFINLRPITVYSEKMFLIFILAAVIVGVLSCTSATRKHIKY
ncbi:MAG: FtsX-like permease family protein [Clostridia bacterium]|nr:FtsX-like permease family protein [Clostridia bacterium]